MHTNFGYLLSVITVIGEFNGLARRCKATKFSKIALFSPV